MNSANTFQGMSPMFKQTYSGPTKFKNNDNKAKLPKNFSKLSKYLKGGK